MNIEGGHLALLPSYRGSNAMDLLWALGIEHELNRGIISAITTAPIPGIGEYYIHKFGCERANIPAFKYAESDKKAVSLLHLDMRDTEKIRQLIIQLRSATSLGSR